MLHVTSLYDKVTKITLYIIIYIYILKLTLRAVLKSSINLSHCRVCLENSAAFVCSIRVSVSNFFWFT